MVIISHFKINSQHFDTRGVVEDEIMGKSFSNIEEFKEYVDSVGLTLIEWWTIGEECERQNDEIYPTDSWVAYCVIHE
ncbi:hypothetical protein J6Q66_05300 [bacterium]|nr:hypothetical protein [bacterium]